MQLIGHCYVVATVFGWLLGRCFVLVMVFLVVVSGSFHHGTYNVVHTKV